MSVSGFDRFVQQEQSKIDLAGDSFDPIKAKQEWLESLRGLYSLASGYLESYVGAGQVGVSYRSIMLNEELLGVYEAREMLITVGSKTIRLEPVGAFILGAKGRVDVIGPHARAQLLLLDGKVQRTSDLIRVTVTVSNRSPSPTPQENRKIDWVWRLVTRPPQRDIVELTRETFLELLVEIGNG